MQLELLGRTAIRKSSKMRDITDEYAKRLPKINQKEDYVNYTYFLAKVSDFDLLSRIDS